MMKGVLPTLGLIFVLFAACNNVYATPAPLPLTPHETVRSYLENGGGHALIRQHIDLHPDVIYNPFVHFTRVDVPERFTNQRYGTRSLSDVDVLREIGYYLPGIDDEAMLTSGRVALMHSSERQAVQKTIVRGAESVFEVTYREDPPVEARKAFEYALKNWADVFPCKAVQLRVLVSWQNVTGSRTLAAAVSPFSVLKRGPDDSALRPDAAYTPTMAAAVGNKDYQRGNFHTEITFNAAQPWHFSTDTPAGIDKFDLATVAAREITHGLFFTGALLGDTAEQKASFQSIENHPGRFDQFISMSNGVGIARSCNPREMYRALTTPGLSFRTTSPENSFTLFAPVKYRRGWSTYGLDAVGLERDCERHNISKADCSNLMAWDLGPGYTQHSIGVPTLRIMRTVLSDSPGLGKSICNIPAPVDLKPKEPKLGILDDSVPSTSDAPTVTDSTSGNISVVVEGSAEPEPTDGPVCFPGDATVTMESGKQVRMDEVKIGDSVSVGGGKFSQVFVFTHRLNSQSTKFVQLHTASGHSIQLTPGHFIYASGQLKTAQKVDVGDKLRLGNGAESNVVAISSTTKSGIYNPQTTHGDIVVDGVLASTFTETISPHAAQTLLAPLRAAFKSVGVSCNIFDNGAGILKNIIAKIQAAKN